MPISKNLRIGEVSCRVTEYVIRHFERMGLPTAHLTQGLDYTLEELQSSFALIPWDDYLIFFRNSHEGLDPKNFVELCTSYNRSRYLRPLLSAAGLFIKPARYFEMAAEPQNGALVQVFRCLEPSFKQVNSREVELVLRVREGFTLPPDLFWQSQAIGLGAVTSQFGLSPSVVTWKPVERGAVFHIRLPAYRPLRFALLWLAAWFRRDLAEDVRSALAYGHERGLRLEQEIEERKRIESALRETKQRFRSIWDSVPGFVYRYVLGPDSKEEFTYVSAGITPLTGLARDEVTADASKLWSVIHPDDVSALRESIRVSARDYTNWSGDFRFVLADGSIRWVSANATLESSLGNAEVVWNGIVTDVTERHVAEARLREQDDLLHKLSDQVPGVIYQFQQWPDGRSCFPYASKGIQAIYEVTSAEIQETAETVFQRLHPNDFDAVVESIRHSRATLEPWRCEYRVNLPQQGLRWLEGHSVPERMSDGSTLWHGFIQDITDRKLAEEALLLKETAIATSINAIAIASQEGAIVYVNDSFVKLWGYGRASEILGRQTSEFCAVEEETRQAFYKTAENGSWFGELRCIRRDGSQFDAQISANIFRDEKGRHTNTMASFLDITERKRIEGLLRISEERWKFALEGAGAGVLDWDIASDRILFSDRWYEITGYTVGDFSESGDGLKAIVHPDDLPAAILDLEATLNGRKTVHRIEHRLKRADGSWVWIESRSTVNSRGPDGAPLRMIGTHTDITDRKIAEQSLRASEERFRAFMQNSPIVAWIVSDDGRILFANDNFGNAIGLPPEEALGKHIEDLFAPEHAAEYFENNRKVLESGVPLQVFEQVPRPDGTMGLYMCYKFPLPTAGGNRQLGGLALDITEQKRAEDALRESEARYRRAERGTNDGLWEWNIVTGDDYFSPRWLELLGYSVGELPYSVDTFRELLHPDDRVRVHDAIERHLHDDQLYNVEMRLRCKDGNYLWVQSRGQAERNEAGVPLRMTGSITDISDRRRALEALRKSEDRLQQAIRVSQIDIFDHDHLTNSIYWSPEQRIFHGGNENDPATLDDCLELIHPDDREEIAEAVRKAHDPDGPGLLDVEHRLQGADGKVRWIATRSQTYFEGEGDSRRPVRTVGAVLDFTDRKRAEEKALRSRDVAQRALFDLRIESERAEQFYRMVEQAGQGIGLAKLDGSLLYMNPAFCKLLEISPETDITQYTFWDVVPEHYQAFLADTVLPQARETGSWSGEFPLQTLSGRPLDIFNNVFQFRGPDGQVVGYSNIATDITDLKRIENELRESEGQLAEAQRIARIGNWSWEPSTNMVTWSEAICSLFGVDLTTTQPSFEAFLSVVHPDDRSTAVQRVEAMLAGADEFANDLRIVRPDGVCLWLQSRARAIRDAAGNIVRVDGTDQDITERKQTELALGASELRYRTLFETSSDSIFLMSIDGRIRSANAAAAKTHGYTLEELLQMSIQELDTPESAAAVADRMQRLQSGESLTFEVTHMRKDGSILPMEVLASAVMVDDEWLIFGFNRDITDRKKAELREAAHILRLKRLAELSLTLSGEPNVVFERLVRIIGELFAVRVVCLSEIVGDQLHFRTVIVDGQLFTDAGTCPMNITPCATVQISKDVQVFDTVAKRFPQATFLQEHRAESYCGFPSVDNDGNVVAVTCLLDDKPREFTEEEQHILRIIGQRLASEVERSRTIAQRQKAEGTLRESEERLRIALSAATAVAFVWDVQTDRVTRYFSAEPALPANLYAPEPVAAVRAMVYPEDMDQFNANLANCLASGTEYRNLYRIQRVDGTIRWLEEWGTVKRDASGKPAQLTGISIDVTDRKEAEQALLDEKQLLQAVFGSLPGVAYAFDQSGQYLRWNHNYEKILGWSDEDMRGLTAIETIVPRDRERVSTAIQEAFEKGQNSAEFYALARDGREIPLYCSAVRITLQGQPCLVGFGVDISDRIAAETALRTRESQLRTFIENAPAGVAMFDRELKYISYSRRWLTDYGLGDRNLVGRSHYEIFPEVPERWKEIHRHCLGGNSQHCDEDRFDRANGMSDYLRWEIQPWYEASGEVGGVIFFTESITDRVIAEERLRASLREKEVMLKEIHHRVKNNLQVISSLLSLQSLRYTQSEANEVLNESQNRIRAMALVHETLYRSDDLATVDLSQYLKELSGYLFRAYGVDGSRIQLDFDVQPVTLSLDKSITCGLLVNEIVSNSLKHAFPSSMEGTVTIVLNDTPDGRVHLRIVDNGIGLPAEFDLAQSSSLGLQLVDILTEQLSGQLTFGRDRGTSFEITFSH